MEIRRENLPHPRYVTTGKTDVEPHTCEKLQYVIIALLVVTIGLNIWPRQEPAIPKLQDVCDTQCQEDLYDWLKKQIKPILEISTIQQNDFRDIIETIAKNSTKTTIRLRTEADEIQSIKNLFMEAHRHFVIAAEETDRTLKSTLDSLKSRTYSIIEDFSIGSKQTLRLLENAAHITKTRLAKAASVMEMKLTKISDTTTASAEKFEQQQESTIVELVSATDTLVHDARSVGQSIKTSMSRIENIAGDSFHKFNLKQEMLIQETEKNLRTSLEKQKDSVIKLENTMTDMLHKLDNTSQNSLVSLEMKMNATTDTVNETLTTAITALKQGTEKTEHSLNEMIVDTQTTIYKNFERFHAKTESVMGDLDTKSKTMLVSVKESSQNSLQAIQTSTASVQNDMQVSVENFRASTKGMVHKFGTEMNKAISSLQNVQYKSIEQINVRTKESVQALEQTGKGIFSVLNATKNKYKASVDVLDETVKADQELMEKRRSNTDDLSKATTEFKHAVTQISEGEEIIRKRTFETMGDLSMTAHTIKKELFNTGVNDYVTWTLLIMLFAWSVMKGSPKSNKPYVVPITTHAEVSPGNTNGNPGLPAHQTLTAHERSLNIPNGPPRYDVTIVTFSDECLVKAPLLFSKYLGGKTVQYRVLTGRLDLSSIPSSKGYIVVIGTDARNSILEDMDGSAGSRKRETVTALQKTEGDTFVVYLDNNYDMDEPPDGALVNPNLARTVSHPILRGLVSKQRLLTLRRDTWNSTQTNHLKAWARSLR